MRAQGVPQLSRRPQAPGLAQLTMQVRLGKYSATPGCEKKPHRSQLSWIAWSQSRLSWIASWRRPPEASGRTQCARGVGCQCKPLPDPTALGCRRRDPDREVLALDMSTLSTVGSQGRSAMLSRLRPTSRNGRRPPPPSTTIAPPPVPPRPPGRAAPAARPPAAPPRRARRGSHLPARPPGPGGIAGPSGPGGKDVLCSRARPGSTAHAERPQTCAATCFEPRKQTDFSRKT